MAIWYVSWPFGMFHGHLVNFPRFGMLYEEKSGNPAFDQIELSLSKRPLANKPSF
jgi:hypothetical protein